MQVFLRTALTALAVGLPTLAAADEPSLLADYTLSTWNLKDGLPRGSVRALAQDSSGMLWIGTVAGLYRLDGAQIVGWNGLSESHLPEASIGALAVDGSDTLWVGYAEPHGALFSIQRGHVTKYGAAQGFDGSAVQYLGSDREGAAWLGTSRGLYRLESSN